MSILNNSLLLGAPAGATTYQVSRSLRFNAPDSAYLSRTPSVAGNRKTWTWAGWVKRSNLGITGVVFGCDGTTGFLFNGSDQILIDSYNAPGSNFSCSTSAVYRDCSAWYHFLLAFDSTQSTASDRLKFYVNNVRQTLNGSFPSGSGDYHINNTVAHYIGATYAGFNHFSGLLADIHFIDGQALDPSSFTTTDPTTGQLIPKAYAGTYGTNGFHLPFSDNSSSTATTLGKDTSGNSNNWTPNNLAVTGSSTSTTGNISLGSTARNFYFKGLVGHQIGCASGNHVWDSSNGSSWTYRGLSGSTVTLTSTYLLLSGNTNISFTNTNSDLVTYWDLGLSVGVPNGTGTTYTWNVNAYGAQNIDSLVDTPTSFGTDTSAGGEVRGNYPTLNPLSLRPGAALSNGNLDLSATPQGGTWYSQGSTMGVSSGSFYWEVTLISGLTSSEHVSMGIASFDTDLTGYHYPGYTAFSYGYTQAAAKVNNGSGSSYGATYTNGDVIGISLNMSTGALVFYKNGTSQGTAFTVDTTKTYQLILGYAGTTPVKVLAVNFGQRPFAYPVSGFKALCDTNLPSPLIAKPSEVFQTVLWDGDGTSTRTITVGFEPDLIWEKVRNNAQSHLWYDVVRGFGSDKAIGSNSTIAEGGFGDNSGSGYVSGTTSTGFSIVKGSSGAGYMNSSGYTQVAWCWDAGSSTVTNTQGSITSSVRANASSGFSIVTYQGNLTGSGTSTVGHGLGVKPSMIITKKRSGASAWTVQHASLATANTLIDLNSTAATYTSAYGTIVAPTSNVFTIAWLTSMGDNGADYVAYCFAPVTGYSSFGSYTGNGSADGPFVFTGHRSRWIMIKRTDSAGSWIIWDSARDTYNYFQYKLAANLSSAENDPATIGYAYQETLDSCSNGFKLRSTNQFTNTNGATYVFVSFAENPFQYARAR